MDSDFRAACGSWLCIGFAWFLQYLWVLALFKKLTIGEVIELYVVVVAQLFRRLHTSHPPRCSGTLRPQTPPRVLFHAAGQSQRTISSTRPWFVL